MPATETYNGEDYFGSISHLTHAYQNWTHLDEIGMVVELPNGVTAASPASRRYYMDQWIRNNGGLGYWQASTGPITLSGGGDPRYHGQYEYIGHYAGKPVYQRGTVRIACVNTIWTVADLDGTYIYQGNGGYAYPSQVDWWTAAQGRPENVPTFSRGWGGTVSIPRWPKYDIPPGPSPLSPSWTQQAYVYQPSTSQQPEYTRPYEDAVVSNEVVFTSDNTSGEDMTTIEYLGPPIDASTTGKEYNDGGVEMQVAPVPEPLTGILQPDGTILVSHTPLPTAAPGDGTIFGFSPLVVLGVAAAALFLMSSK